MSFLSLSYFVQKTKVLSLYRSYLRKLNSIEVEKSDLKWSLLSEVQSSFRANSKLADPVLIKTSLIEGERYLKKLDSYVTSVNDTKITMQMDSSASKDTDDDIRNRIGEGWPWEEK